MLSNGDVMCHAGAAYELDIYPGMSFTWGNAGYWLGTGSMLSLTHGSSLESRGLTLVTLPFISYFLRSLIL